MLHRRAPLVCTLDKYCVYAGNQDRKRLLRADVSGFDVLVAEALDFVLSLFLIEADSGRSHDFTGALARGIKLHLKITERVVGSASVAIEFHERHVTSCNDG